jgi:heme b synthase
MPQANELRLVFWETTVACNLRCVHCRACPTENRPPDELSFDQACRLLSDISTFAKPVIVLSGGEPLVRDDISDLAAFGTDIGLRMVLATNGTLLDSQSAMRLKSAGIQRISVSIDGADAPTHDAFRRLAGAFESAMRGIECARSSGIPVQINATVAHHNIDQLPSILDLAIERGACALHLFLLVPTGCGKDIAGHQMISPDQYESVLNWLHDASHSAPIELKATCAPHYARIARQAAGAESGERRAENHPAAPGGCLAGTGVCFVSHRGEVFPCGYFPVSAGNVLDTPLGVIWARSELFRSLRDPSLLKGKCGLCEYRRVCGGCRARAYAETGDYLAEEPYCVYMSQSGSMPEEPHPG